MRLRAWTIAGLALAIGISAGAQDEEAPPVADENPVPAELRYQSKPEWQMVAIEALVVEINDEHALELGMTYGLTSSSSLDGANIGLGSRNLGSVPVAELLKGVDGATDISFANRMPGLGISLAGIDVDSAVLAAQLRMMLDNGEALIRTRPIVVALNKTPVEIETVDEIPYVDIDEKGKLGIQKKKAGVRMIVTPTIVPDYPGAVTLDISNIEISSGSTFITLENVNRPVVSVSRTHTRITLREGETFIVGGLKTRRETVEEERVPILGSIPIIRWLFTSRHVVERNVDVLFFITPNILEPGENFLLPYDFRNGEFLGSDK